MRDRYNLNLLPGMSEDGMEYGEFRGHGTARPGRSHTASREVTHRLQGGHTPLHLDPTSSF